MRKKNDKINILTLGNSNVGKTCYIIRFTKDTFKDTISNTGIDLLTKTIELDKKTYKINFFDTAGQERFKSMSANLIKSADGILLFYDITSQISFDSTREWMESIISEKGK